jgi:hypothetical protein
MTEFTSRDGLPVSDIVPILQKELKEDVLKVYPLEEQETEGDLMTTLTKIKERYQL